MVLRGIHVYPVKSLGGCAVAEADVDALGLAGDRRFLVVDPAGRFLTQRTHPRMALIATRLDAATLTLSAVGAGSVAIPRAPDAKLYAGRQRAVVEYSAQHGPHYQKYSLSAEPLYSTCTRALTLRVSQAVVNREPLRDVFSDFINTWPPPGPSSPPGNPPKPRPRSNASAPPTPPTPR